ncbi:MAG: hypothetical protein KF725_07400 [Cyclobacteriaceae bacterium]|nr:hypothetical protein [Cyclobacteriaceae bacterium]
MNKLFAIAFTCIYLLLTVGVAKTTHYCMGRAKSAEIFSFEAQKCACSGFTPENSGCCQDEHEIIKVDDNQSFTVSLVLDAPALFSIRTVNDQLEFVSIIDRTSVYTHIDDYIPPPEALFKVNCSFLFYDGHDLIV